MYFLDWFILGSRRVIHFRCIAHSLPERISKVVISTGCTLKHLALRSTSHREFNVP